MRCFNSVAIIPACLRISKSAKLGSPIYNFINCYPSSDYESIFREVNVCYPVFANIIDSINSNSFLNKRNVLSKIYSSKFTVTVTSLSSLVSDYPNRYFVVDFSDIYNDLGLVFNSIGVLPVPKDVNAFIYLSNSGRPIKSFGRYILIDYGGDVSSQQLTLDFEILPTYSVDNWLSDISVIYTKTFPITNADDWKVVNATIDTDAQTITFDSTVGRATYLAEPSFGFLMPKILSQDIGIVNGVFEFLAFDVQYNDYLSSFLFGMSICKQTDTEDYCSDFGENFVISDDFVSGTFYYMLDKNMFDACLSGNTLECCKDSFRVIKKSDDVKYPTSTISSQVVMSLIYQGQDSYRVYCNYTWYDVDAQKFSYALNIISGIPFWYGDVSDGFDFCNQFGCMSGNILSSYLIRQDITDGYLGIIGRSATISNIRASSQIFLYAISDIDFDTNSSSIVSIPTVNLSDSGDNITLRNTPSDISLASSDSSVSPYIPNGIEIKEVPTISPLKKIYGNSIMVLKDCEDILYATVDEPLLIESKGRTSISYTVKYIVGRYYRFVFQTGFIRLLSDESKNLKTRKNVLEGYFILERPFVVTVEDENSCVYTIRFEPTFE